MKNENSINQGIINTIGEIRNYYSSASDTSQYYNKLYSASLNKLNRPIEDISLPFEMPQQMNDPNLKSKNKFYANYPPSKEIPGDTIDFTQVPGQFKNYDNPHKK